MFQKCGFADATSDLDDADLIGCSLTPPHLFGPVQERAHSALGQGGLDINELTPAYDRGETALLAMRLAREFIAAKAKKSEK